MPDSLVGNFRVGKEIGRGSFAVVFKGHHVVSCAPCTPNSLLSFAPGIIFFPRSSAYSGEQGRILP